MIQLVKARKLKKRKLWKRYKQTKKRKDFDFWKIFKKNYLKFLWPLFVLLFVVFWVTIVLQKTVFDDTNYIKTIDWSTQSIKSYDNPYLYEDVSQILSGKNVYKLNYFWTNTITAELKKKYPVLQGMKLTKIWPNKVAVHLNFIHPQMLFQLQDRVFWIWESWNLEVFSGNTIVDKIFKIHLPLYASWVQNIAGIFYDIPQKKIVSELSDIYNLFPQAERIVYMPWSQTTVIFVYKKKVYINHTHNVKKQINTFYAMEKYYTGFQNISVIDLGSLEEWQAIVK